ncbi:unnamed protein product [Blepharisma stoltei]|uniref:NADH dehydrogenase subunit 6 n=1 Tax=Blepharisma stoltei TaxID=1481888 RepID=A0AAU9IXH0_9CILI|nr:unnamed protein product [Blepharisma stoltei]
MNSESNAMEFRLLATYVKKVKAESILILFIAVVITAIYVLNVFIVDSVAYTIVGYLVVGYLTCALGLFCANKLKRIYTKIYFFLLVGFFGYNLIGILFYIAYLADLLVISDESTFCTTNLYYDCGSSEAMYWLLLLLIFIGITALIAIDLFLFICIKDCRLLYKYSHALYDFPLIEAYDEDTDNLKHSCKIERQTNVPSPSL